MGKPFALYFIYLVMSLQPFTYSVFLICNLFTKSNQLIFRLAEITVQNLVSQYLVTFLSLLWLFFLFWYKGPKLKHLFIQLCGNLVFMLNPGESVTVEDEVVVVNSIVLPHKTLNVRVQDEILL